MKDCIKCGQAFDPLSKFAKVCEDCKLRNKSKAKGKRIYSGKPYYKRV